MPAVPQSRRESGRRQAAIRGALVAGFALLCAVLLAPPAAAQGGPASVRAERVELQAVTETTPILAELVPTTRSEVAARTAGIVQEVLFRVGDPVEAGQLLVRLDRDLIDIRRRTAAAALETARAGVAVAEAQVRLAVQAFERQQRLQGSAAFSRGQFEDLEEAVAEAESERARSEARVAEAEAALARADYDTRHAEIRAPFSGVVIAKSAQPGAYIDLGEPVATLLDVAALEIEANLPVKLVGAVRPGLEVTAVLDARHRVTATVRSLLPVETAATRTRPVRLSLDTAALDGMPLAAGKSVLLEMPVSAPREAVTVPKDALVQSRGGWQVFTVEDGKATPRPVELGEPVGARMEVLSGLLPGDVVVTRGNERLRPGQPVTPEIVAPPEDERAGEAAAAVPGRRQG